MKILLTITCIAMAISAIAQDSTELRIRPSNSVTDVVSFKKLYRYPAFTPGMVYLTNGGASRVLLDYNLLLQEMQYINSDGDTLALYDNSGVKYVVINSDTFFILKSAYESVQTFPSVKLVKQERLKVADIQKRGGYNLSAPTGAVTSISNMYGEYGYRFRPDQDVILSKDDMLYFITSSNEPLPVTKKNIYSVFASKKSSVNTYLKSHDVNMNKEADVKQMVEYLYSL